ncbi:MAG: hypothetical protein J2P17_29600, partial [Mycobacterium sp.]|nr:hypothetical protein [Mycobacterium sp.]
SVSGLASAAGGGAAGGAIAGAVGGVGSRAFAGSGEGAPAQPRAGEDDAVAGCATHSFVGSTAVLMADGTTKPISRIKVGDRVADAVPGSAKTETHTVGRVIVTRTDHDFVKLTIKRLGKATAGIATAAAAITALATPAQAATVTTTYHHPFYDITQSAFVDANHLHPGDLLQSTHGGKVQVTATHRFHDTTTTYDLTINGLHTYYVLAGSTPLLVHNCGDGSVSDETELLTRANAARDAELDRLSGLPSRKRPATVVGAYNLETGDVTVGASSKLLQECAEACAVRNLGGDPGPVRFTRAFRPNGSGENYRPVPVCAAYCEPTYGRGAFPDPETEFESDLNK